MTTTTEPKHDTHTHTQSKPFLSLSKLASSVLLQDWSSPRSYYAIAGAMRWKARNPKRFALEIRTMREEGLLLLDAAAGTYTLTDEGRRHIDKAAENSQGWVSKEV